MQEGVAVVKRLLSLPAGVSAERVAREVYVAMTKKRISLVPRTIAQMKAPRAMIEAARAKLRAQEKIRNPKTANRYYYLQKLERLGKKPPS